jgi:site-specific recombinase XerD
MIEFEVTGRPYNANHFRVLWRQIADECGVPATVRNQDSRAGAISEATDAGVDLEHIRHAATHSDIATTQRYSRGSVEKTANVLRLRVEHRNKGRT